MHARQLVTILSICLSQAHARSIPTVSDPLEPIVRLVTTPHEVLGAAPDLKETEKAAIQQSPYLYSHQIAAGLAETTDSLHYLSSEPQTAFSSLMAGSLLGYYRTIMQDLPKETKESRLQIYRNSFYSRTRDVANHMGPEVWNTHATLAKKSLENGLQDVVLEFQKSQMTPAGDEKILNRIEILAQKFKNSKKHQEIMEEISKAVAHMKTHLPYNVNLGEMKYLSAEEVESALKGTNIGGHPDAIPVNYFLVHHEPATHQISPAKTPITNSRQAQLPPSQPKVATAPTAAAAA
ncbi:uncharacterized protein PGTG_08638 [Puccinia graminis f. sp. tritici CRL 75-36-700-3]|uniref:Uncharacterized protein n=1 Tax=Puccinia graminis f. sp. tritici (strain CRL 75-36-700-3 / race SCCL) TaxID=418459 RepID=E3KGM7_PUCGT|nr:uncharacterized protein PGTG_08638 [Puccinia graminis f. sp. tritici CRL 75-36-700-3]EFP83452.1 hypothetical protein PGTG_08638 [Puccinia graminis f. sp. tritici CRL 75-36-700-3]